MTFLEFASVHPWLALAFAAMVMITIVSVAESVSKSFCAPKRIGRSAEE